MTLLWLAGGSGPPGSGVHEGMYGGYHTSTDRRLPEGAPSASGTGLNASCWGKASFPFFKQCGSEVEAGYPGVKGVWGRAGVGEEPLAREGGQRPMEVFQNRDLTE